MLPYARIQVGQALRFVRRCPNELMRLVKRLTVFAATLAILSVAAVCIYSYRLRRRADNVVRSAYELSQKHQSPTIEDLRRRFGSALEQPSACTANGCGYQVLLSNRGLAALRLTPYAVLRSSFWAKDGVIESNLLEFWSGLGQDRSVLFYVQVKYCQRCDSFLVVPWNDMRPPVTGSVEMGSASTTGAKHIALALNTGCLTRLGGCATIADVSPSIWQRTSSGIIRCRIPNHEGDVDNPVDLP